MTDRFSIIPIEQLFNIIQNNLKKSNIFGIPKELFFVPDKSDAFRMTRFSKMMETPIGVAAGPHSQMAQNIITSWLCGARYIELKTVQTLDELNVSKPCIDMQDEGYNCEWSQELKLHESFSQYLDAWILIHVLKHQFGWDSNEAGVIFNMSVGYNMDGILNENVQWFFNKMNDAKIEKEIKIKSLAKLYPEIKNINIPDCISDNITLSTMHGCPPEEIEKIGLYLIENKKIHTTIKLNPTLIGKEKLREILNNELGFQTIVPDEAFAHDLKYPDALKIINSLRNAAEKNNVFFGLKLTNTLEAENHKNIFPEHEKMMYMSGRALHPLSIQLADKLQKEFKGTLDISFSAGADCFNISDIISSGLKPVTVCSDILKPGGYGRLNQYIENLKNDVALNMQNDEKAFKYLSDYSEKVAGNKAYKKNPFFTPSIKTNRELHYFDCIHAPCVDTCPTNQDIPEYLYYASQGNFQKAYEVIMRTNPFPNVLGMVCDHLCQSKCTRTNYDNAILIRDVKRFIAEQKSDENFLKPKEKNNLKVAIIGAGPSGLACAYFLALTGYEVNVYETKNIAGGMVSDAIPEFRLTSEAIKKDIELIKNLGVNIHYNYRIREQEFNNLQKENNFIYIAVGAQKAKTLDLDISTSLNVTEKSKGVLDSLRFLSDVRRNIKTDIGKNILVIGGGNTAMDVARTAKRLAGNSGTVTLVYRRTKYEMPADKEEILALLEENIPVIELTAPEEIILENGILKALRCSKMKLSEKDNSGRAKPVKIVGSEFNIECDTIIPALGQDVAIDFIDSSLIKTEVFGYETQYKNIFIGGDALRGGATVIKAVADGRKSAEKIFSATERISIAIGIKTFVTEKKISFIDHTIKRAKRKYGINVSETTLHNRLGFDLVVNSLTKEQVIQEALRCLYCDDICNVCVSVCPNRANYSYETKPISGNIYIAEKKDDGSILIEEKTPFSITQKYQILNISDFCNECGNCTTFCPTAGKPFDDKPKFYLTIQSFKQAKKGFYLSKLSNKTVLIKKDENIVTTLTKSNGQMIYENALIHALIEEKTCIVKDVKFLRPEINTYSFEDVPEMCVLLDAAEYLY